MSAEVWRAVPGYVGSYEVSDLGNVRSLDRIVVRSTGAGHHIDGRPLRPSTVGQIGYPAVNLNKGGTAVKTPIHRLVLLAFVGPLPKGLQTRHLNGDHTDNRLVNLVYGTPAENTADKMAHGTARSRKTVATHCQRNHEFTPENTGRTGAGHRLCKTCLRARGREFKRARRLAEIRAAVKA